MSTHLERAVQVLLLILSSFFLTFISVVVSSKYLRSNNIIGRYLLEYTLIIVPLIFLLTTFYTEIYIINLILLGITTLIWMNKSPAVDKKIKNNATKVKPFITNARSTINIVTGIAILAVDFKIFPVHFQKTLAYGFSLMDVGVGLYVFANGIVAQEIRGQYNSLRKTFLNTLPLLVIGIGRFLVTALVKYKVNASEYGVHWNFFITLAVTKLGSALMMLIIKPNEVTCAAQGLVILAIHQFLLNSGLDDYVFSNRTRDNFIDANREGICSSLGYIALYFLSVAIGFLLEKYKKTKLHALLIFSTLTLLVLTYLAHEEFNISRCLANSTYCFWILFIGVGMTCLYSLMDDFLDLEPYIAVPFICDSINFNGLTYFLVANVSTGLVNLLFEPGKMTESDSFIILFFYMFFTTFIVCYLFLHRIKLKI